MSAHMRGTPPRPSHPRDTSRGARSRATPPMEGNWFRDGTKANFPSAEGCRRFGPRENCIFAGDKPAGWSLIEILHFCPGADDVCVDCSTSFYFVVADQAVYHNINRNFGGIGTDFFFEI